MSEFKVGDRVRLLTYLLADDGSIFVAPRTVGIVEADFEDGMVQVRFKNGIPHDAVHWVKSSELAPAASAPDADTPGASSKRRDGEGEEL